MGPKVDVDHGMWVCVRQIAVLIKCKTGKKNKERKIRNAKMFNAFIDDIWK